MIGQQSREKVVTGTSDLGTMTLGDLKVLRAVRRELKEGLAFLKQASARTETALLLTELAELRERGDSGPSAADHRQEWKP
jgi:hypothetical protein